MIESYRDLTVWQKGLELAERVYTVTSMFPQTERFGLVAQMRRAVVSIPSNIAEGKASGGGNYIRHLRIAHGSEAELQTQIEIAFRLRMLSEPDANVLLRETSELGRMLTSLIKSLSDRAYN